MLCLCTVWGHGVVVVVGKCSVVVHSSVVWSVVVVRGVVLCSCRGCRDGVCSCSLYLYLVANGLHEMAFQTAELKHYIDMP